MRYISYLAWILSVGAVIAHQLIYNKQRKGFILVAIVNTLFIVYYVFYLKEYASAVLMAVFVYQAIRGFIIWGKGEKMSSELNVNNTFKVVDFNRIAENKIVQAKQIRFNKKGFLNYVGFWNGFSVSQRKYGKYGKVVYQTWSDGTKVKYRLDDADQVQYAERLA